MDLREQACWLLLVFESGLSVRIVNSILALWGKQQGRTLQDFFAADVQEWRAVCNISDDIVQKLEQAREKQVAQAFLAEQLQYDRIQVITVLDAAYPVLLKRSLGLSQLPPLLFVAGDLNVLHRQTIAIIGARKASKESLAFTTMAARYIAAHGGNVISGYARGVDYAAFEGASGGEGYTTAVLPHGIRKLSKVQLRELQPGLESGKVLVLSQFHPVAPWQMSRAMERNHVVTALAHLVIVAESDKKGGTWDGANEALKQKRPLYVRSAEPTTSLLGNQLLIAKGGQPLPWPLEQPEQVFAPLLKESVILFHKQQEASDPPTQLSRT